MSATGVAARIGPNAITRVAEVLGEACGPAMTARVFAAAGLTAYVQSPPVRMVDEREVIRLHAALRAALAPAEARAIAREAGWRTGAYLLAHRIPRPVQALLQALPAPLAARVLLAAIGRHAWTFAGSGQFAVIRHAPVRIAIAANPLCRGVRSAEPACDYYSATFERLFRALVHPQARVREVACEARGDPACVFEVRWRRAS